MIYVDIKTGRFKIASHFIFDEAHMSSSTSQSPIAAQALQQLSYTSKEHTITTPDTKELNPTCEVKLLTTTAKLPAKSTDNSIGYNIYSDNQEPIHIKPGHIAIMTTEVAIKMPDDCYVCVAPRSGLTIKQNLTTLAGIIDPDYCGDIGIILQNFGSETQTMPSEQRIAQFIFKNALQPTMKEVPELTPTDRGQSGFGSIDTNPALIAKLTSDLNIEIP